MANSPKFQIVPSQKSSHDQYLSVLPDPEQFAQDGNVAGTKADFGDGVVFVLTAPTGWRWLPQRGRKASEKPADASASE